MMIIALVGMVCLCALSSSGAGAYFYLNPVQSTTAPPPTNDGTDAPGTNSGDVAGLKMIKYGAVSMVVPPKVTCKKSAKVYFQNTTANDSQLWNLDPVANKDGVYYVRSEHKAFKNGCPMYLTSPQKCSNGSGATIEQPKYLDRQQWQITPSGSGYQLQSVGCQAARGYSYLTSSGVKNGPGNTARMSGRMGNPYSILDPQT